MKKVLRKITVLVLAAFYTCGIMGGIDTTAATGKQLDFYEINSSYFSNYGIIDTEYGDRFEQVQEQVEEMYSNKGVLMPQEVHDFFYITYPELYRSLQSKGDMLIEKWGLGSADATTIRDNLSNIGDYNFDIYNRFVVIYNTYMMDEAFNKYDVSFLVNQIMHNSDIMSAYGLSFEINEIEQEDAINNVYDELYHVLSERYADPDELKEQTYLLMKQAVSDWIREVDLDFIKAYQSQLPQYLAILNELGYTVDVDQYGYEELMISDTGRSVIYSDLTNAYSFGLDENFLSLNLNSTGTEILSAEDVLASEAFQNMIYDRVENQFDSIENYDKDTVVATLLVVIHLQYNAIKIPASGSYNPLVMALPQVLADSTNDNLEKEEPLKPVTSWIDSEIGMSPFDSYRYLNFYQVPKVELYSVTWLNEKGSVTLEEDENLLKGDVVSYDGSQPSKASDVYYYYTFAGWADNPQQETGVLEENLPVISEDVKYYVAFSKTSKQYTVTYHSHGGSEVASQQVIAGEQLPKPIAPTKEGYVFLGWYLDEELTNAYDFNSEVTSDLHLHAAWKLIDEGEHEENDETPRPSTPGKDTQLPDTGDTTNAPIWMVIMVGAGILILVLLKRKNNVRNSLK